MTGQEIVDRWRQQALNMGWITGDAPPGAFLVLAGMIDDALNVTTQPADPERTRIDWTKARQVEAHGR